MTHSEFNLQSQICHYLNVKYPNLYFLSDTIASLKLTKTQAQRNSKIQKRGFKCPDLVIYEPVGKYHGLFIELKVVSPYTQKGELKKQKVTIKKGTTIVGTYDHLEEQEKSMQVLRSKGYYATFSWGFDKTIKLIDDYLSNNLD
jgi:hypothetical protein